MVLLDLLTNSEQLSEERVANVRKIETRSHEGVADLLNSITNLATILIDYHIDNLLIAALFKVLREVGQRFSSRNTEK